MNAAGASLGDGDTGMTISRMIERIHAACAAVSPTIGDALTAWSRECMRASESSLGTVIALGLSRAEKLTNDKEAIGPADIARMLSTAIEGVTVRAGSKVGDKAILDSLDYMRRHLSERDEKEELLALALAADEEALNDFRGRQCKISRARMYAKKSIGVDDPGMLAAYMIVEVVARPLLQSPTLTVDS